MRPKRSPRIKLTISINILFMLIQSLALPSTAFAQDTTGAATVGQWDRSNFQDTPIIYAETPSVNEISAAGLNTSQSDLLCYWEKLSDEFVSEGSYAQMIESEEVADAISGKRQFKPIIDTTKNSSAKIGIKIDLLPNYPDLELVFVRAYYRGTLKPTENMAINVKRGATIEKTTTLRQADFKPQWNMFEFVYPKGNYENLEFSLEMLLEKNTSSQPKLDFIGLGYCLKPQQQIDPEIWAPATEIASLIVPIRMFRNSLFVNHGTAASVFTEPTGKIYSFEKLWELGKAGQVLNRRWALGANPFGITEGVYLGDKLWMGFNSSESWYHAIRTASSRCFDEQVCMDVIAKFERKLAAQIASGNVSSEKIQFTRDLIKFNQGKLAFYRNLLQQGNAWLASTPVNITYEVRQWELSRPYDGGLYSYVKAGELAANRIRSLGFPDWIKPEEAKKIFWMAVQNGAPRNIRVIIGEIELQISAWERWAPNLRSWNVPSIITAGGIAGNMIIVGVRSSAAFVGEYYPYAAVTLGASDATFDAYTYMTTESQLSFDEMLISENLFVMGLSNLNLIERSTETVIGEQWSSMQFCIPRTSEIFLNYDSELASFTHPDQCSYMDWRISDTSKAGQITVAKKDTQISIPMLFKVGTEEVASTTYSMVLADQNWGLVFADFTMKVESYNSTSKQATMRVTFAGFRTPEEYGKCGGWLPKSIIDQKGWNREECHPLDKQLFLPTVQR